MILPPVAIDVVDPHVEGLFRRGSLCESVASIGAVDKERFQSTQSIEETEAGLLDTCGVRVVLGTYLATAGGAVAYTASLFGTIGFDHVGPNPVEDGRVGWGGNRGAKHILLAVLVELFEFARFPVRPVVTGKEFASGQLLDGVYTVGERCIRSGGVAHV